MANTVYDTKEIVLQGGKQVELRPLPIGLLKKLMKAWGEVSGAETEDDIFEVYINCSGICLSREFLDDFEKPLEVDKDGVTRVSEEYHAHLEDIMDMPTIYEVLDVCGGLKLNDPKLAEAVEEAVQDSLGTT